ncbi:MAG: AAA family ATPase [Prochloraceae cyanobacterium]|nr:AAA family ATPase [Prochloraceae cyanobacterium]
MVLEDGRYITTDALKREKETIALMEAGRDRTIPLAGVGQVGAYLEALESMGVSLTAGQREAIALSATSTDRILAWQGIAGSGKTFALSHLKEIIPKRVVLTGIAPTDSAVENLQRELGIECVSLAKFLRQWSNRTPTETLRRIGSDGVERDITKQALIVDEAGMIGAEDMRDLLKIATLMNQKVILIGDKRQLKSVAAGNPFVSLLEAGITTAFLPESIRQKVPDLKEAVEYIGAGHNEIGLGILYENNRVNVSDSIELELASSLAALPTEKQYETLIICATHGAREAVTEKIRSSLTLQGTLKNPSTISRLIEKKGLSRIQKERIENFHVGDFVISYELFNSQVNGSTIQLKPKSPYKIIANDNEQVLLEAVDGSQLSLSREDLFFNKSLYKTENIEIAIGDKLSWTRSDKNLGLVKGNNFVLADLKNNIATIRSLSNGELKEVPRSTLSYTDYAWTTTSYQAQGQTAERVFLMTDGSFGAKNFYVDVSRVKRDLRIFTSDYNKLIANVTKSYKQENPIALLNPKKTISQMSVEEILQSVAAGRGRDQNPSLLERETIVSTTLTTTNNEINQPDYDKKPTDPIQFLEVSNQNTTEKQQLVSESLESFAQSPRLGLDPAVKIQAISSKLKELSNLSTPNKQQKKEIYLLTESLANWKAVSQIQVGDRVSKIIRHSRLTGTLAGWNTRGNFIEAWVNWDNNPTTPETPSKLMKVEIDYEQQQQQQPTSTISNRKAGDSPVATTNFGGVSDPSSSKRDRSSRNENLTTDRDSPKARPGITDNVRSYEETRERVKQQYQQSSQGTRRAKSELNRFSQDFKRRNDELRGIPLDEIAPLLGLEQDRHDLNKWVNETHKIGIYGNGHKFKDFLTGVGGNGAIDFVMYVRSFDFKEAVNWLQGGTSYSASNYSRPPTVKSAPFPSLPPKCNIRASSSWNTVRNYLVEERLLPSKLIDSLHQKGLLDADLMKNAMFFRHRCSDNFSYGEALGASLRSTGGSFKGLTAGTKKDEAFFWFQVNVGQPQRVVVCFAPIDCLSFAALDQTNVPTVYLSSDGTGPVPVEQFKQIKDRGGEIVVATDSARAGELMAWKIIEQFPTASRICPEPKYKDWNDQLKGQPANHLKQFKHWPTIAAALKKDHNYLERVKEVVTSYKKIDNATTEKLLPSQIIEQLVKKGLVKNNPLEHFHRDLTDYQAIQSSLRQWHKLAHQQGASSEYLTRIAAVAADFNGIDPKPLKELALAAMEKDLSEWSLTSQAETESILTQTETIPQNRETSTPDKQVDAEVSSSTDNVASVSDVLSDSIDISQNETVKAINVALERLAKETGTHIGKTVAQAAEYKFKTLLDHHINTSIQENAAQIYPSVVKYATDSVNKFVTESVDSQLNLEKTLAEYINKRKSTFDGPRFKSEIKNKKHLIASIPNMNQEHHLQFNQILEKIENALNEYAQPNNRIRAYELFAEYTKALEVANATKLLLSSKYSQVLGNGKYSFNTSNWQLLKEGQVLTISRLDNKQELLKTVGDSVLTWTDDREVQKQLTSFASELRQQLKSGQQQHIGQARTRNRSQGRSI